MPPEIHHVFPLHRQIILMWKRYETLPPDVASEHDAAQQAEFLEALRLLKNCASRSHTLFDKSASKADLATAIELLKTVTPSDETIH
jgi:hypothetical protein